MPRFAPALILFLTWLCALRADPLPAVISLSPKPLAEAKASLVRGESGLQPALAALLRESDRALTRRPSSVMDKAKTAASGDKHDYYSQAPYWWPDPSKPDGLPYVRRDGEVNPESKKGTDSVALAQTCNEVETLGLAFYFTGRDAYATKAAQLVRIWFLDTETRMNPHLDFGQAVPGRVKGRGEGVLEARHFAALTDGLALLAGAKAWTPADEKAFRAWMAAYYEWLRSAPIALEEKAAKNNHGSWYDAQAAHLAVYLGKKEDAVALAREAEARRIRVQIEPDGSQPLELARTKSLDYCIFNLSALFRLSTVAEKVGVDLLSFSTPDQRSLKTALYHLAPYADPKVVWPKKDLVQEEREHLPALLVQFLQHHPDPETLELVERVTQPGQGEERWRLLWNIPLRRI